MIFVCACMGIGMCCRTIYIYYINICKYLPIHRMHGYAAIDINPLY